MNVSLSQVAIEELEDHRIQTWRDIAAADGHLRSTLICVDPNATLFDAARTIQQVSSCVISLFS